MSNHDIDEIMSDLKDLYKLHYKTLNADVIQKELNFYKNVLPIIRDTILEEKYELLEPVNMGGSGVIFKVKDLRAIYSDIYKALKIPRPLMDYFTTVKNESDHLISIQHDNIIRIHYLNDLSLEKEITDDFHLKSASCPIFIMDYIEGPSDLNEYVEHVLSNDINSYDDEKDFVSWFVKCVVQIAEAINTLHKSRIIHFDIKPANILIGPDKIPRLTDLGFAKKKTNDKEKVLIGYTSFYAHQFLYEKGHISSSENRMHCELPPKDFQYIWDIYSFGKSILELLSIIHTYLKDACSRYYELNYIHLMSCRMLDELNSSKEDILKKMAETPKKYWHEQWYGLKKEIMIDMGIYYKSLDSICKDLSKIGINANIENKIPELLTTQRSRIQVNESYPAPFTYRVSRIAGHPCFKKLKHVKQIGLMNEIFPTANHTRYEHSLGVFSFACEYIRYLWYDENNPLFRQWVNFDDIEALLVAALLHDIGHYPLAHDIEEIINEAKVNHAIAGLKIIDACKIKDDQNKNLKEIIEEFWQCKFNQILSILKSTISDNNVHYDDEDNLYKNIASSYKDKFLSQILSSDIDVDKLDYLIRDSYVCDLFFGNAIDFPRLLRTLTVSIADTTISTPDGTGGKKHSDVTIGIYEKGESVAQSIGLIRYLLYHSLYWHHTYRSIKSMIREILKRIPNKRKGRSLKYIGAFIKHIDDYNMNQIEPISEYVFLRDLNKYLDSDGKEILKLLINRNFYKRIYTLHRTFMERHEEDTQFEKLRILSEKNKLGHFAKLLRKEIKDRFVDLTDKESEKTGSPTRSEIIKTKDKLDSEISIIVDIPKLKMGSELSFSIIPELESLKRSIEERMKASEYMRERWAKVYKTLFQSIQKIRIFCHPDIRRTIVNVLSYTEITNIVERTIRKI